ncbi:sigma-70 family RNA polymerase sigma factor [Deinococcus psychrotolerans]|uniref:Sigma-70 family RNA polymerase sigma factor n=2 Tax=Deinococcus psychrotolerans TaxID=2489213 RepID=A0A3G8YD52_9DEIO|nr:sigma-70 family RNA polymerase sigma factor [Deinococcus psychrotolerans]
MLSLATNTRGVARAAAWNADCGDTLKPMRSDDAARAEAGPVISSPVISSPAASDAELIARFALRDEAALGELFDRYHAAAYGLALYILKESATAQEIVHDSFLKVWAKPQLFDPQRAAFSTFILTVVRHAAISKLRGVRFHTSLEDEEGTPLPLADERVDLLTQTEQRQVSERVQAALSGLKPPQRETVERAYYRGQTREEIAAAMQVPVGTVKSRLKYALERLRGVLSEQGLHDAGNVELGGEVESR